jgi:ADP-dependent NAD(P)H-hydrate dehydratase / NAD(P)H-hydrate epimerase
MIPLYSTEQVRAADSYAISKLQIPGEILMENAAISITESIFKKYPYIDFSYSFGIVCGKGNNGGDGFALARQLLIKGFTVEVLSLATEKELKGDALTNYKIIKNLSKEDENLTLSIYSSIRDLQKIINCEIIVDAILGTGSSGELTSPINQIVEKLNRALAIRIAIDSPTGLKLTNSSGDNVFNANFTVTLAAMKTGLFYEAGKRNAGKVVVGSIGIGKKYFETLQSNEYLVEPEDVVGFLPKKDIDLNKYTAGKTLVVAGSSDMPGAAIFAMNAAMISGSGAGLLTFPKSLKLLAQAEMNSAIVLDYEDEQNGYLQYQNVDKINENAKWADAIAIGPGLGRDGDTQKAIIEIINNCSKKTFVIDADAISALNNKKYMKIDLFGNVFTPHHKEFADLLGVEINELKMNLLDYGKKFTKETQAYLVLKGAPTIIFNPDGEVFINSTGNAGLAKFGSGDVLTGIIASFIAQQQDVEKSITSAVYLHGLTADLLVKKESEFGITPQKLIEQFPSTIKFLRKSVV